MILAKSVSNFVTSGRRRTQKPGYKGPHDPNFNFTLILILVMLLVAQNWVKILELGGGGEVFKLSPELWIVHRAM